MKRLLLSAAIASLLIGLAAAQTDIPQIGSPDVLRVGAHIACKCGSCKDTVACPMALQGCGFCNPARTRIAKMQAEGKSDKDIIDVFVKEYGPDIYRADPNNFFWMIPYLALAGGLMAILFFLKQSYAGRNHPGPALAGAGSAANVEVDARYLEAAEKETSGLD